MGWLEWRERLRTQGGTASVLTVRLVLGSCEDYCCPPAFSGARARLTEDLPTRSVEAIVSRLLPYSRIVRASSVRSGGHDGGPAAVSTLASSGFEAGVGAFDDHAAFHLGEGCHDVE